MLIGQKMKTIGLIINPIAGMGGRLGLKGTDGDAYKLAIKLGAKPFSPKRAIEFLNSLDVDVKILVPNGIMGEEAVKNAKRKFHFEIIKCSRESDTTAEDTKKCAEIISRKVDLLVFVGGDGTARDICDSIKTNIPVLGVPAGVKVYSAVFANTPRDAAEIVKKFIKNNIRFEQKEVLDIDENEFRSNRLKIKLYGYLTVPASKEMVEGGKTEFSGMEEDFEGIANYVVELIKSDEVYFLGPGTTTSAIARKLGVEKTLLGVDAILNNKLIGKDLNESKIIELAKNYKANIIVSPIGGQGFIFGRGNQQFSPEVIKLVGKENIIIVSSKRKLQSFKSLKVDTGDEETDNMLRGYFRVIVGYHQEMVVKVV